MPNHVSTVPVASLAHPTIDRLFALTNSINISQSAEVVFKPCLRSGEEPFKVKSA